MHKDIEMSPEKLHNIYPDYRVDFQQFYLVFAKFQL
jgi:hypothetical protein